MMRPKTIAKRLIEIDTIDRAAFAIVQQCENDWGFVPPRQQKQVAKMYDKVAVLTDRLHEKLHSNGLTAEPYGATDDEANQPMFVEVVAEIKALGEDPFILHHLGNGDWCG